MLKLQYLKSYLSLNVGTISWFFLSGRVNEWMNAMSSEDFSSFLCVLRKGSVAISSHTHSVTIEHLVSVHKKERNAFMHLVEKY